jgi:molybdenum cofactor biosynthesis protein B
MHEHRRDQKAEASVALMITSDTRTPENDETGKTAMRLLEGAGHRVAAYVIVENEIITSGGTGISSRDRTVDAVSSLFEKELPGFGELFRRFSFEEIGEAAMYSRATAGVIGGKLVFCLPGSRGAVDTALRKLILPGLGHMLWEVNR